MLKIPIKNNDRISIQNQSIIVSIDTDQKVQKHRIPVHFIPYYYTELSEVKNEKDRIEIARFFLTDTSMGLKRIGARGNDLDPILKMVEAKHDPYPRHYLHLFSYGSLQSVQWHLVCHGLSDFWLVPHKPYLMSGIISEDRMEKVWKDFVTQVQCARWKMPGLPDNAKEHKKQWNEMRKELEGNFGSGVHGCCNCINEQGAEKFITCCNFFKKYRIEYLKKLRRWIIDTIQDNGLVDLYAEGKTRFPNGKVSQRRHLHVANMGAGELRAYIIEEGEDESADVYLMIFRLGRGGPGDVSRYTLKTVYGIKSAGSVEQAKTFINVEARKQIRRSTFLCHESNWAATSQTITH